MDSNTRKGTLFGQNHGHRHCHALSIRILCRRAPYRPSAHARNDIPGRRPVPFRRRRQGREGPYLYLNRAVGRVLERTPAISRSAGSQEEPTRCTCKSARCLRELEVLRNSHHIPLLCSSPRAATRTYYRGTRYTGTGNVPPIKVTGLRVTAQVCL